MQASNRQLTSQFAALLAVLSTVCLLEACNTSYEPSHSETIGHVTLRIGVAQAAAVEDSLRGLQQASSLLSFEGLTSGSKEGRPRPRLAESWSVSPDGLRWTVRLRRDARFHDGTPVDATSVKRSLDASLGSVTDRSFQPGLEDIVGIDVADSHALIVRLRNRSTFMLDDLSMAISKPREDGPTIGTGPFIPVSSSSEQIVMSRFADYYQGAPEIEQIVWKPYPALRTAWAAMMRGEIDFLYEVGQESVEFVEGESSVSTYAFLRPYVFGVAFNSRRPSLEDRRVRQALNFAVNRQQVLDQALKGRGVMADGPVWPAHWAYDSFVGGYGYDPTRASAILDAADRRLERDSSTLARPARLRFSCLLIENLELWERMALLVQRQLFDIGVDMKLEPVSASIFSQRISKGDFDAAFLEIIGGYSMVRPYVFWYSRSPQNSFGYHNEDSDRAFEDIRQAFDDDAYRAAVGRLQQSMVADPPGIFLAWGQTARAVSRKFVVPNDPDRDVLLRVSEWQLAGTQTKATN